MLRTLGIFLVGATMSAVGLMAAAAQGPKPSDRSQVPGGIEGHIKSVDRDKQTVTVVTSKGSEQTFTVTDETTIVGPRGGKVRYRLKDRRFHEGIEITIVANGSTARELHLGYDRGAQGQPTGTPKATAKRAPAPAGTTGTAAPAGKAATRVQREAARTASKDDEDEDNEVPGTIKSYDPNRRMLVVTLLNGRTRSFLLPREVKVVHRGILSRQGLEDPALKAGASVTVHVDAGGRRVRELQVNPAPAATTKSKKAA